MFSRFRILFQIMMFSCFQVCAGDAGEPPGKLPKRVLMYHSGRSELPAIRAIDPGLKPVMVRLVGGDQDSPGATSGAWRVHWEELKKWGVPENWIPMEAAVRLKEFSMWEEHRLAVLGIIAVVVIQSLLITGLFLNRATRLRAKREMAEGVELMNLAAKAAKAANLGMWAWDVSSDDIWMTEQARSMFGIKRGVRIDHAVLLDRVHPEDRQARERAIREALDTHGEYELDYRIISPEGKVKWFSARGRCVASSNGRGQKLLGVSMDVTARKELEMGAAQQRQDQEHLSRLALMGEMAASLAHELNQPLTAIVTNARAAQRFIAHGEMDPLEFGETLTDIVVAGRRAGDVIRGIKSMVRKVDIDRHVIDANQLIENVVRLVRGDALAHGCNISTEQDARPALLMGDATQLQQVLLNLVINAFDAMRHPPCNPCRMDIGTRRTGEGEIEVSVRDFGPGLSPEVATKIFDRFFSTKTEGMGMGLSIARSIIEAHGGMLGVGHPEGGGARFWFRVPGYVENNGEVAV